MSTDTLGLTDVKVINAPTIYAEVPTPITFEITVSCTAGVGSCAPFTTDQVETYKYIDVYMKELYMDLVII